MSYHQRPHELRLAISAEAEALISDFGGEAYGEARRAPTFFRRRRYFSTDLCMQGAPGRGREVA